MKKELFFVIFSCFFFTTANPGFSTRVSYNHRFEFRKPIVKAAKKVYRFFTKSRYLHGALIATIATMIFYLICKKLTKSTPPKHGGVQNFIGLAQNFEKKEELPICMFTLFGAAGYGSYLSKRYRTISLKLFSELALSSALLASGRELLRVIIENSSKEREKYDADEHTESLVKQFCLNLFASIAGYFSTTKLRKMN